MTEKKWTPGPWYTDEHLHDAPHQEIKIGPKGNYHCAKVWQDDCAHDYNPEQKSNAHLIAAASELYDALENAMAAGLPEVVWHDARAALAKARGER